MSVALPRSGTRFTLPPSERQLKLVIRIAAALIAVFIGVAVWFYFQGSAEPTTDVTAPPVETTLSSSSDATARVFEITDESSATFELDEELRGQPTHVTGVSNLVLGQISIDPDDLSTVEVGTILVKARGFTTGPATVTVRSVARSWTLRSTSSSSSRRSPSMGFPHR